MIQLATQGYTIERGRSSRSFCALALLHLMFNSHRSATQARVERQTNSASRSYFLIREVSTSTGSMGQHHRSMSGYGFHGGTPMSPLDYLT